MTVGEFTRKLKEAVNAEGYTSNNISIERIDKLEGCFKVICVANDGNEFTFFIE